MSLESFEYPEVLYCGKCGVDVESKIVERTADCVDPGTGKKIPVPYKAAVCPVCGSTLCERDKYFSFANMSLEDKAGSRQDKKSKDVTDYLPQEEILAQLAEEAAELSQAALKLRRVLDGKNPTPIGFQQAVKDFNEEVADVQLCLDLISFIDNGTVKQVYAAKMERWKIRLYNHGIEEYKNRFEEERRERYAAKNAGDV